MKNVGNINTDKRNDASDVANIRIAVANLDTDLDSDLTEEQEMLADVNADDSIDAAEVPYNDIEICAGNDIDSLAKYLSALISRQIKIIDKMWR